MQRHLVRFVWVMALAVGTRPAAAQSVETPVPFDSAGRVMAVTPVLATRLRLDATAWPITGDYREARLYAMKPAGGYVLVVQRATGALERTTFSDVERNALRDAIDAGMSASGRPTGESGSTIVSEPAGFAFARDQTVLGLWLYGPLAASLVDDGTSASAAYLLVAGGSFFASYAAAQSQPFTRAQNDLAAHLAVDGAAMAGLISYAADNNYDKPERGLTLAAAVTGTIVGASLGRSLTDAESHAASAGVMMTGLTGWGISAALGAEGRAQAAVAAGSGIIGYGIGLAYPRNASYTVTAGDVNAVYTTALLGAGVGGTLIGDANPSDQMVAAVATPAYLIGAWAGDRLIAKRFDLTMAQGRILQVGAVAGSLMGLALPVLSQSGDVALNLGFATAGGIIGTAVTLQTMAPRRAGLSGSETGASRLDRGRVGARDGLRIDIAPALVGALSGAPGKYSIVHWTF